MTRIAFGADHAGYELKQHLIERLRGQGHEIIDHGTDEHRTPGPLRTELPGLEDVAACRGRADRGRPRKDLVVDASAVLLPRIEAANSAAVPKAPPVRISPA